MSLRVALVCPYSLDRPGGVATHVLGLARWLQQEGHRPVVVAPGVLDRDRGVPVTLLGATKEFRFNGSVAQLAVLPAQSRRAADAVAHADVVHVHEPLTPGAAFAAARAARSLVVTHHASFGTPRAAMLLRLRAALLPDRVTIAVSRAAAVTARAVTDADPVIIPNAITAPPARSAPGRAAPHRPVVVFVGRLDEPRKGYSLFRRLAGQVPGADFVAIGPGGCGDPRVTELGQLDDDAKSRVLANADVLVAPNRFGESFGMIIVEGLAHGCAVVAADLPAFRDVVDHPRFVSWFPVDDVASARAALLHRLAAPVDPAAAHALVERYTWPSVGPRILAAYRRVAPGAPRADVG
jgi:phosphatidylinositol alpha-mannosyltransferase